MAASGRSSVRAISLLAQGEPMVWLSAFGLVMGLVMVTSLVVLVFWQGLTTFWPAPVVEITTRDGAVVMGEVTRSETFRPEPSLVAGLDAEAQEAARAEMARRDGRLHRRLVRTGNFELTGEHFRWVEDFGVSPEGETRPAWAIVYERRAWGRFYGTPAGFVAGDSLIATDPQEIWNLYRRHRHDDDAGEFAIRTATAAGQVKDIALNDIVRAYPANRLSLAEKAGLYLGRWWEFLTAEPREANSEGGVFPAIFGTVLMTLGMTILVVPFGVMSALYLREYAKQGWLTSVVRISINNLAGVPSIVFGVFGLGFFSYFLGGGIDALFFADKLPNPTFGTGGIMWASLTLALLTLPVVIVATEEALSAVPDSMREGSFACGATRWQTIRRVVLPRSLPGIMTGAILAMARGAGEVAPLMLVGAVKLAPDLPLDLHFPFLHPERSFMHLGFHIYDLGFQSQNSEAAKPMVFTTTLLLMGIVLFLNAAAIMLRTRLARKYTGSRF
ncbi:phosphate ABC transporter, permease protein PstA [bacterium CG17_big_fil_post_rev_8_21_14_2_50_64_8]|nr:MAG: phosphate ABC transporter, permease protein PstA [bacterium CG17_big_fil_post_rev_8_21_14_2_50_64_8]PJA74318.1 MAG: phosphate ABC transporter, permease protein PstA [bacterium CG_4_9_14_3_um_filter_65_15]